MLRILGIKIAWQTGYVLINHRTKHRYLDHPIIDKAFDRLNASGVTRIKRNRQLIVSLTSFPQRMYDIHYCLYSLLTQSLKPDQVILWLAPEEFPDGEKQIPEKVLRLQQYGLSIQWCENLKPYNKLLPALEAHPDDLIVTVDDDIYYLSDWLKKLYEAHQKQPEWIHCHWVERVTFDNATQLKPYLKWERDVKNAVPSKLNVLMGVGGVLYPPQSLHQDVFNKDLIKTLCPTTDDLWFWTMAVLNNRIINLIPNHIYRAVYVNLERELGRSGEPTLCWVNNTGGNEKAIRNILTAYPELLPALQEAHKEEQSANT